MAKIVVRPTCIIINDYDMGSCIKLESNFRMYDMTTHSIYYVGLYYDKENRKLYLMRNIDLWYVQSCLEEYNDIIYENPDEYDYIDNIKMKYSPRDDVQKECLKFMIGLGEYSSNQTYSQLCVNLNTGKGKSYTSIYTMAYTKIKSIIITYSVGWLKQWKGYIEEYTNLKSNDIYMINGAQAINMILYGKSKHINDKIYLVTHSTINSYGKTYGWDKIRDLFKILKIGNLFIDEAHLNFDNICRICFSINVYKTYFITATPARSDRRENEIYQLCMKNAPSIDLFDPDHDPHTEYVAIKWNSRPTPQQISDCRNQYGLDRNKYTAYIVNNDNFELFMFTVMEIIIKKGGRALFYIGTNEAIVTVYKWICKWYPEFLGDVGIYTTIVSDKRAERDKRIILSTTKSAGAAEDFKGLKTTVVLAEPFKSEVVARQTLGRTRDSNTIYIESVDIGFRKIKQFYYDKLPIFNKYASSTSDISLNQLELENRATRIMEERENVINRYPFRLMDTRFEQYEAISFDNYFQKSKAIRFF